MPNDSDFARLETARKHASIDERMESLHEDVTDIKGALNRLTDAITKLALIEQQQAYAHKAQERAFQTIERIESRVSYIEQQLPLLSRSSVWTERAMVAGAGAAVMFVAKQSGLFL
jgi:hypothetical protein